MLGAPFETADIDEWERMLDVNVRGLLHTGRAFIDDLLAAAEAGGPPTSSTSARSAATESFPELRRLLRRPRPPSPTSRATCAPSSARAACA